MGILRKSKHWLAPLSVFLLGSPAMAMAMASEGKIPTINSARQGVSLTADDLGDLHLSISHKAMTGAPTELKDALLDLIHNDQSHRSKPIHVDPEGKAHFLVQLGKDEAGTEIHLKPLSTKTPVAEIVSLAATGLTTLLSLKVADIGYSRLSKSDHLPFGFQPQEPFFKDHLRNYGRQSILLSTFAGAEAINGAVGGAIGQGTDERTTWKDAVPQLTSSIITGLPAWTLHDSTKPWYDLDTWTNHVGMYHTSATTNNFNQSLIKLNEAALNDLTSLNQTTVTRISQAAAVVEGSVALLALDSLNIAGPGAANGTSWFKSALSNSMAITLTYNFRNLMANLSKDVIGDDSIGEFLAAAPMAAGAAALQLWGARGGVPMAIQDMNYSSTVAFLSAEAAGASLGFGLQKLVNQLAGDENSTSTRTARIGSTTLAGLVLKGIASRPELGLAQNVLSPMGDGIIIANTLDIMMLAKDTIIEPWVVTPLLKMAGVIKETETPAIRLKTDAVRRPLFEA